MRKWSIHGEYAQILDAKSISLFVLCDFQSFLDISLRAWSSLTAPTTCPSRFISLSLTVTVLNWKLAFESIRSAVVTTDPIHHQPWCSFQGKNSSEQDLATALKEQETRSLGASRKTPNSRWLVVKVLEWGTETISYDNWGWDRRDFVSCKKSTQNSSSWKRAHLESLEKDRIAEETVAMVTCSWVQG